MSPVKIAFKVLFIHIFLLIAFQLKAQIGGNNSFTFLNIPSNPVTSGLGGINISKANNDPNVFLQNPALLDSSQNNLLAINYLPYFSSIKYSSVAYVSKIQKPVQIVGVEKDPAASNSDEEDLNHTSFTMPMQNNRPNTIHRV